MYHYYVNKNTQANGDHEVHKEGCSYLPELVNRIDLGNYYSYDAAVIEARKYYYNANGCYYCCKECHTN